MESKTAKTVDEVLKKYIEAEKTNPPCERVMDFSWNDMLKLKAEIERLRSVLYEYANVYNWNEDSQGIRRVWLEPKAAEPATYNGFEMAMSALTTDA